MSEVKREHKAGLELFALLHGNDLDSMLCEDLDRLIAQASAAPEQEAVAFVADGCLRNLRVSGFDSYSALLHKQQASMVSPQLVALYTHADPSKVERLRAELNTSRDIAQHNANCVGELEKKLAEAQALLRETSISPDWSLSVDLQVRISDWLSATAQPAEVKS